MTTNQNKSLPADFRWVEARSKCSIAVVFAEIRLGAIGDCEQAQAELSKNGWPGFETTEMRSNRFAVIRSHNPAFNRSVEFVCNGSAIEVNDGNGKILMTATLTLTDEGECKLKVGDRELDQWQFRRAALEELFFPAKPSVPQMSEGWR
jgi:hypothetical protein